MLMWTEDIVSRWKEYLEELLNPTGMQRKESMALDCVPQCSGTRVVQQWQEQGSCSQVRGEVRGRLTGGLVLWLQ